MTAASVLGRLAAAGVVAEADGDRLRLVGHLPTDLRELAAAHKHAILAELRACQAPAAAAWSAGEVLAGVRPAGPAVADLLAQLAPIRARWRRGLAWLATNAPATGLDWEDLSEADRDARERAAVIFGELTNQAAPILEAIEAIAPGHLADLDLFPGELDQAHDDEAGGAGGRAA